MLEMKFIRENYEEVFKKLKNRNEDISGLDNFLDLDKKRRELILNVESFKNQRNEVSSQIAELKRANKDATEVISKMGLVSSKIKALDAKLNSIEAALANVLLTLPNIPHSSVPIGTTEEDNVVVRTWGELPTFNFTPKPHWEIAEQLDILDFEKAAKVSGSRFVFYKGLGARLERALANFMLDLHVDIHGYTEVMPPYIVNRASMTGTGQLPKFEEDAFKLTDTDYFLIPTSEVPVTNMYANMILDASKLPIKHVAFSSCFRSEAGSAGRDTRGLIRQHQFNKVELVHFEKPEDSYSALETIVKNAEQVLKLLKIPYQVLDMCTADLGFTAAKKYDIEVWVPSAGVYREISSCSNFETFQARRAGIRFRRAKDASPEFLHTLNGSGLAIGRTIVAILENFQQSDGTVLIPEVLQPYMGGRKKID